MEKALNTEPIDLYWYGKGGSFVQKYPPGASSEYAFEWSVENRANTYVVVRLDFFADKEGKRQLDFKYDWGPICDVETQPKLSP